MEMGPVMVNGNLKYSKNGIGEEVGFQGGFSSKPYSVANGGVGGSNRSRGGSGSGTGGGTGNGTASYF